MKPITRQDIISKYKLKKTFFNDRTKQKLSLPKPIKSSIGKRPLKYDSADVDQFFKNHKNLTSIDTEDPTFNLDTTAQSTPDFQKKSPVKKLPAPNDNVPKIPETTDPDKKQSIEKSFYSHFDQLTGFHVTPDVAAQTALELTKFIHHF